jgi:hypothetical protein
VLVGKYGFIFHLHKLLSDVDNDLPCCLQVLRKVCVLFSDRHSFLLSPFECNISVLMRNGYT